MTIPLLLALGPLRRAWNLVWVAVHTDVGAHHMRRAERHVVRWRAL